MKKITVLGAIIAGSFAFAQSNTGVGTVSPNSTMQVAGSFSVPIAKKSGTVTDSDYTILGSGNVTLPSPTDKTGRIYNFIYDGTAFTVIGSLRLDGNVIASYGINNSGSMKRITVQSDGTNWVILY